MANDYIGYGIWLDISFDILFYTLNEERNNYLRTLKKYGAKKIHR